MSGCIFHAKFNLKSNDLKVINKQENVWDKRRTMLLNQMFGSILFIFTVVQHQTLMRPFPRSFSLD